MAKSRSRILCGSRIEADSRTSSGQSTGSGCSDSFFHLEWPILLAPEGPYRTTLWPLNSSPSSQGTEASCSWSKATPPSGSTERHPSFRRLLTDPSTLLTVPHQPPALAD
ncbi:MAG: hypothetical protein IPJ53_00250 [Saprospiraceae bacterium]|nr:hypothetical protein [Candidatus Vicinibacter affinis]